MTLGCMGTWRKASFRSNPAHHAFFWNHFLTAFMSSIWKWTCLIDLLNRFRFRMGLHLSGDLLDFGTTKYELTYCPGTGSTSQIAPLSRSPWTSLSRTWAAVGETEGLRGAALWTGALFIQAGLYPFLMTHRDHQFAPIFS